MVEGSCLCGKVHYQVNAQINNITHCHCVTCRKAHASAFSSVAAVKLEDFRLEGKEHLKAYESSEGKQRHFCSNCGSQVYAKRDGKDHIVLRLGTIDTEIDGDEKEHIWVSEKASWYSFTGNVPRKERF